MSKITDYPPGPGINGSEQVLIATPAGPASTNYTYTMADILAYAGGGGGGAVAWGAITGTLSAQGDLNTALGLKITNPLTTTGDVLVSTSGTTPGRLPIGSNGQFLGVTGGVLTWNTPSGTGDVVGPASATAGRIAVYNGTTGKLLQDGTKLEADVVTGPASVTTGRVASYNGTTGKLIADGGILVADVVTGPASATSGRVATFNGTTGKILQDSATPAAPTAAVDTNTTQLATTAFVVAQAASATPAALGTAAVGTSLRYARGDHVHASVVTTTGDILYSSSGVALGRLAIGSAGQVLGIAAGIPAWVTDPRATTLTSFSAAYPIVLADANTILLHPSSDTTARTVTIPANASVAFPTGTMITIDNQVSAGALTIAITTDTLEWVGTGATGSRTVAAGGQCTIMKITSTRWRLSGVGVT